MISQTSLDSWLCLQRDGRVCANQRIILDVLDQFDGGLTNDQIRDYLNREGFGFREWQINQITPRVNELVKLGRVFCIGTRLNVKTGMQNKVWISSKHKMLYWKDFAQASVSFGDGLAGLRQDLVSHLSVVKPASSNNNESGGD